MHMPCVIGAMIQFILDVIFIFQLHTVNNLRIPGHPARWNRIIESKTAIIAKKCVVNIFHFVVGLRLFGAVNQSNIGGWRVNIFIFDDFQFEHVQNLLPSVYDLAYLCIIYLPDNLE